MEKTTTNSQKSKKLQVTSCKWRKGEITGREGKIYFAFISRMEINYTKERGETTTNSQIYNELHKEKQFLTFPPQAGGN